MRTNTTVHRFLAVLLALCLTVPSATVTALADGKSGKKSFKEGMKYEQLQQWDLAAQEFAMAVAAEPNNAEYKLHYARALQNASLMFLKRGDELAKQGDYASAYNAYRQSLGYDQGNEMASLKMKSMLELQKDQVLGLNQYKYNEKTGNLQPISNELQIKQKPRNRDAVQDIKLDDEFKSCVKNLARMMDLNVLFDESVRVQNKVQIELRDVTLAKAFDLVLQVNKMTFQQVDRKTILIYANNQQTRNNFEQAVIKPYYLGNIKTADARQVLNTLMPGRPVAVIEDQKVIILKGTPSELQLVQDVLESVDKNINEVIIDVEIYEVSNDAKLQIGNQIAADKGFDVQSPYTDKTTGEVKYYNAGTTASLGNLGGLGRRVVSHDSTGKEIITFVGAFAGQTLSPLPIIGSLIGIPPTSLSLLQSKGNSRLLNKIQIHALDGQPNNTKVGKSVPVSLGQNFGLGGGYGLGVPGVGIPGTGTGNPAGGLGGGSLLGGTGLGGYGGGLVNNIQYKDVGLVIEATPKITNEGYVEIKMKIETSNVEAGADPLTPNSPQRSLNTTARIQDGVTSIVASVMQDSRGNSRTSIPIIGMLPLVGRLFTAPNQSTNQSDIIITVTPHIIRAAEITKEDNLAKLAGLNVQGGQGTGLMPSIEDVLFRAQLEEEQERRLIAAERGVPAEQPGANLAQTPAQIAPGTAPNAVPVRNVSNPGNGLDKGLPAGPSGSTFQPASNNGSTPGRKNVVITGNGDPNSGSNQNYSSQPPIQADTSPPIIEVNPTLTPTAPPDPATNPTLNPNLGATPNPNMTPNVDLNAAGGEKPPEMVGQAPQIPPGAEIKPAVVTGATRPPKVEQYIQEQLLLAAKERAAAAANKKQPAANQTPPVDYVPAAQPRVNAAPAVPKPVANKPNTGHAASGLEGAPQPLRIEPPKAGMVSLNLQAQQPRVQVGKTVTLTLQVESQTALTSANLALRFDPTKLRVKTVRDGDMLGKQPDIIHSAENGVLTITANATGGKAVKASGRLIVIEFVALAEGPAEVSFNGGETQVKLVGDVVANLNATATQLSIQR